MTSPGSPEGLAAALSTHGLALAGPLGPGAGGARWAARGPDGARWGVTVLRPRSPAHAARLRARLAGLQALGHAHLPQLGPAVELADGRLAVLTEEVTGTDLETVAAARGSWDPGEVVTVLVPVLQALGTMHAAGMAHGDVSPANVVLTPTGRPVLIDLVTGDADDEHGTPGSAAPERSSGAAPAGDVYAVARLGLGLLAAGSVDRGEDPWASAREQLVGLLSAATAPDPTARPTPGALAAAAGRVCAPEPVTLPDPAVLARLALRRLAAGTGRQRSRQTQRVTVPPAHPRGRHRSPARRSGALLGLGAALVLALCGATVVSVTSEDAESAVRAASAADEGPTGAAHTLRRSGATGPLGAAVRLTWDRAHAMAAGDLERLATVSVPGSPAAVADRRAAVRLHRGGGVPGHVRVEVASVRHVPGEPAPAPGTAVLRAPCPSCAAVEITARVPAELRGDAGGQEVAHRAVVLVLQPTALGWRVRDVRAVDP